jgi:hypothetical protein
VSYTHITLDGGREGRGGEGRGGEGAERGCGRWMGYVRILRMNDLLTCLCAAASPSQRA